MKSTSGAQGAVVAAGGRLDGVARSAWFLSIARARLGARQAARRARRSWEADRARRDFAEFWRLTSRRGRLERLAAARLGDARALTAAAQVDLRASVAGRSIGFLHLERAGGEAFRWTAPFASIMVDVPGPGPARARLELLSFQGPVEVTAPREPIGVDNRIVPASIEDEAIEFEIPAGEHWISIGCEPFRPRRHGVDDPRALGVPVRGLSFEARRARRWPIH